jgi:hypothetical protein
MLYFLCTSKSLLLTSLTTFQPLVLEILDLRLTPNSLHFTPYECCAHVPSAQDQWALGLLDCNKQLTFIQAIWYSTQLDTFGDIQKNIHR